MTTHELLSLKTYPYGYSVWLNKVWQECRRIGMVSKETDPINTDLDPDGWLDYFMEGLHPINAVKQDLYEQA